MEKIKLHIVAFDIPDPPDYGGAIDVFYKVKNLAAKGIAIYLHCPEYGGRKHSKYLEEICEKVWYYPRKMGLSGISITSPFMVYSRRNQKLLENLRAVDAPIFFDGVSTSYYLSHASLKDRLKILRPQNIEQDYFKLLAKREKNLLKKSYYFVESILLKNYENKLHSAEAFFTVALHDHQFFKEIYPDAIHEYIPSFQPYDEVKSKTGKGDCCLYHGNLALAENEEAALYLLNEIIPKIDFPFIIAGRNPKEKIIRLAAKYEHCKLVINPSMEDMDDLIANAQIHVLPTFQNTGLKLKLLHALFNGRYVIVNNEMLHGTGLSSACIIANNSSEMIEKINALRNIDFDEKAIARRNNILQAHYNNRKNAERIVTFLQQRSL